MNESRRINQAVLLSLLLHAVLFAIGGGGSTERTLFMALSDEKGGMNRPNGEDAPMSILLVMQDSHASTQPDTTFDVKKNDKRSVSEAVAKVAQQSSEPKSPTDPAIPVEASNNMSTSSTGAARSVRHSIPLDNYTSQIVGRIERAWVRPLAHLGDTFQCEVRISQTPQGEVREVTLTHCEGDADWRQSIVRAIRYASPLPAPPNEKAFRPDLTLNFQAEPMSPALLAKLLSDSEELSQVAPPSSIRQTTADVATTGNRRMVKSHTP